MEEEYGITLFERSRGSSLKLTEEGILFREMAQNVMRDADYFEQQLYRCPVARSRSIVYLRSGSNLEKEAAVLQDYQYPVLQIAQLKDELFVESVK